MNFRALFAFALCLGLFSQTAPIVEESFLRDPGPLDFLKGEGHEQAILQSLTGDSLVGLDTNGKVVPRLAHRWEISGDAVVFHLREDARFTRGAAVTAEDVIWTIQAIQRMDSASHTKRAILHGVRVTGQGRRVELRSNRPAARLLMELARVPIARQGHPDEGSGPFSLAIEKGEWRLKAREHFLKPSIGGLRFRLIGDEQAVFQNLQKGWLTLGVPPMRKGLQVPATHREYRNGLLAQITVWSRVGTAPLKALERWRSEVLPADFFNGRLKPSLGLLPEALGFAPRAMDGEAGNLQGQRWDLLYPSGDGQMEKVLLALRERAKREGVILEPRPLETALFFERIRKGDFSLACAINVFDPHPWSVLDLMEPEGGANLAHWQDPRLAKLVSRLTKPGDPAWNDLQNLWAERPTSLPLMDYVGCVWVDRRLKVQPGVLGIYLSTPGAAGWTWQP
ncbi:MAG: ABC transporter substrate-binding protein [Firmicutes bacterium]|nr:ABC transporter substrate-binding protein [Bacillota bacterium]